MLTDQRVPSSPALPRRAGSARPAAVQVTGVAGCPGQLRLARRRLVTGMARGVAAALLAACGAPPAGAPTRAPAGAATAGPAAPPAPVTLGWATPGNTAEVEVYQRLARAVESRQPRLTIVTSKEAADFPNLRPLLASGAAPDLLFSTINNWPALTGAFRPLDEFIGASRFDLDDFYPQIIRPYRFDPATGAFGQGQLHGLPKEIAVRVLYYNADQFRAAGVHPPAGGAPFAWEEFLDAARRLTRRSGDQAGQYGYAPEIWWGMWAIWAWANGGEVVDDVYKPTKATLDDPRTVAGLAFWAELVTKHQVAAPPALFKDQTRADFFAAGRAAMYNNGRWMVPLFRRASFAWDVMPMPRGTSRAQLLTGSIFGINRASPSPEVAWQLLSYITGQEGQLLMTELGVLQPSRRSVAESEIFLKVTPPSANQVFLDELAVARPLPLHPRYPEMEQAANEEVERLLQGAQTPAAATAAMNARLNALLRG
jgi:multiple sugar transport system substrate-binding protein